MRKILSAVASACIIIILIGAPMALGAVEPWAFSVMAVLAATACLAAVGHAAVTRSLHALRTPVFLPLLLGALLLVVQYVRWPVGLLERFSPRAAAVYRQAADLEPPETRAELLSALPPSLYRNATRNALICYGTYVALFAAALATVRSERHLARYGGAAVIGGFLVSLVGILQKASQTGEIYWFIELTQGGRFFGPFVSRNQFATYAGVCLFTGVGLLLARSGGAAAMASQWRDNLRRAVERRRQMAFVTGFAVVVMASAVVWSLSRAGTAAMILALVGVGVAASAAGFGRRVLLRGLVGVAAVAGIVLYLGLDPILTRAAQTQEELSTESLGAWKWKIFADGLRIGADHPLLGTGAGTFWSVYPPYRSIPADVRAYSPENEYIHTFAEAGAPGVALVFATMALVFRQVLRALRSRRNPYVLGYLCGGVGMLLMVSLHSLLDFPMRSPAVAATAAVLCGALCRAGFIGRRRRSGSEASAREESPELGGAADPPLAATRRAAFDSGRVPHSRFESPAGTVAALVLIAGVLLWLPACRFALRPLQGALTLMRIRDAHAVDAVPPPDPAGGAGERPPALPSTSNVIEFLKGTADEIRTYNRDDAELWAALADFARAAAQRRDRYVRTYQQAGSLQAVRDSALLLQAKAVRLAPLEANYRLALVEDLCTSGRTDLALQHVDFLCRLYPNDPHLRIRLGSLFADLHEAGAAQYFLEEAERIALEQGTVDIEQPLRRLRKKVTGAARRIERISAQPLPGR